jgi:hypothetical protein
MNCVKERSGWRLTPLIPLSARDSSVTDTTVRGEREGIMVDPGYSLTPLAGAL